jgi:hydroxyacylglutathione hydrolase
MVKTFPNGPFMVNTYLLYNDRNCIIIDPGSQLEELKDYILSEVLTVQAIIATHGHIDHVAGAKPLKNEYNVPFYINEKENPVLQTLPMQAQLFGVSGASLPEVDENLPEEGDITIGDFTFTCLFTPGHSPGSISLLYKDFLFSGDALFNLSIGRTDLIGGNYEDLIQSIRMRLLTLPDETYVLSGHGPETSIGYEKKNNPFLQ